MLRGTSVCRKPLKITYLVKNEAEFESMDIAGTYGGCGGCDVFDTTGATGAFLPCVC